MLQKKFLVRSKIIKAVAHPSRLFIIEQLYESKCSVSKLTEMIGVSMPTVSRHLSILENAGIINSQKDGAMVYYYLEMRCIIDFFKCAEKVLELQAEKHKELK